MTMTTERWLVTGAGGLLGWEFKRLLPDAQLRSHQELDIEDRDAVSAAVLDANLVINLAAVSGIEAAERNPLMARKVNTWGAGRIAQLCGRHQRPFIHVSTTFVFDGHATSAYSENALTGPPQALNAYGRTKLEGERLVLAQSKSYVIRTGLVYGSGGPSPVRNILLAARGNEQVHVPKDGWVGQPTWAQAVAKRVIALAKRALSESKPNPGIYHATATGQTGNVDFCRAVFMQAGLDPERITPVPVSESEYLSPIKLPRYTVLSQDRWRTANMEPMQPWEEMLKEAFASDPGLHS